MLYIFGRILFRIFFYTVFRLQVHGEENIPQQGPALIASNHASFLDPPLIGSAMKRKDLYYMAKESLFKGLFGIILNKVHAFPVKRAGISKSTFKTLSNKFKEKNMVLMFPEGTRSWDGKLRHPAPGAGMIAYNTKARVIPAFIEGAYDIWPRHKKFYSIRPSKLQIYFGEEVHLSDYYKYEKNKQTYQLISEKIMQEISKLKNINYEREKSMTEKQTEKQVVLSEPISSKSNIIFGIIFLFLILMPLIVKLLGTVIGRILYGAMVLICLISFLSLLKN